MNVINFLRRRKPAAYPAPAGSLFRVLTVERVGRGTVVRQIHPPINEPGLSYSEAASRIQWVLAFHRFRFKPGTMSEKLLPSGTARLVMVSEVNVRAFVVSAQASYDERLREYARAVLSG